MADLPSVPDKINDIEVAGDAPITEQLFAKIGSSVNWCIDQHSVENFFSSNNTFIVPTGVERLLILGCGGGGGGGGGGTGGDSVASRFGGGGGGGGGGSGEWLLTAVDVTPAETLTITIGAGGAGGAGGSPAGPNTGGNGFAGSAGSPTVITFSLSSKRLSFLGGGGGGFGSKGKGDGVSALGFAPFAGAGGSIYRGSGGLGTARNSLYVLLNEASEGFGFTGGGGALGGQPDAFAPHTAYGNGSVAGVSGSNVASNGGGGGGGGGACTPWSVGGTGGNGKNGDNTGGASPVAGTLGSGGGGGAGGFGAGGLPQSGVAGAAGGSGFVVIFYV